MCFYFSLISVLCVCVCVRVCVCVCVCVGTWSLSHDEEETSKVIIFFANHFLTASIYVSAFIIKYQLWDKIKKLSAAVK